MDPQQSMPSAGNNYDFILNPPKPPKQQLGGLGNNSFMMKIVLLVGGAVLFMIVAAVLVNIFLGGKANTQTYLSLAQTEQEVIRLSQQSNNADDQSIRNAAANTQITVSSQQATWLTFLQQHHLKTDTKLLALKQNPATDAKLQTALQTSTFNATYTTVMRSELTDYAAAIKTAYNSTSVQAQRATLSGQYTDVQMLLKQWPSSTAVAGGN